MASADVPPGVETSKDLVGRTREDAIVTPVNQLLTPYGKQIDLDTMRPQVLALSPDGKLLLTSGKSSELVVMSPETGERGPTLARPETKNAVVGTAGQPPIVGYILGGVLIGLASAWLAQGSWAKARLATAAVLLVGLYQSVRALDHFWSERGGQPNVGLTVGPQGLVQREIREAPAGVGESFARGEVVYLFGDATPFYVPGPVVYHTTWDTLRAKETREVPGGASGDALDVLERALRSRGVSGIMVNPMEIARLSGIARSTVREMIARFERSGLAWPVPPDIADAELERRLYGAPGVKPGRRKQPEPDWSVVARELKRKHVTLQVLWEEILKRFERIEVLAEPERVPNSFVKGYTKMMVKVTPKA